MPPSWKPRFDFYTARVGEHPASFFVDLAAEAQPSHSLRLQLRVPLLHPRPDGLRDASELEPMGQLEDRLAETLAAKLDALYVGRVVGGGATTFFYYVPPTCEDQLADLDALLGDTAPYAVGYRTEDDAAWDAYTQFLYPDTYSFQTIMNRHVLQQLEQLGDAMTVARTIDHLALFAAQSDAEAAALQLAAAGFTTDRIEPREDGRFGLEFHRSDAVADGRADAFVGEVLDIVLPLGGTYDGWGCSIAQT